MRAGRPVAQTTAVGRSAMIGVGPGRREATPQCRQRVVQDRDQQRFRDRSHDAGVWAVPDHSGQLGDERLDRSGGERRRHKPPREVGGDRAAGLDLAVYGVLRSGEWGWVVAKPQAPALLGLSLTLCLVLGGLIILRVFFWWEQRVQSASREPLIAVPMLRNGQLANARIEALRVSLAVLAVLATIAIFMTRLLPTAPAGRRDHDLATD
jgi:hypothetical protein